jgi:hypothetical protein
MLIGANPVLSSLNPTAVWIAAAANDPSRRLARALPQELDFQPWAHLLQSLQSSALPESQLGASLLLGPEGLEIATEMAWRSRYPAFVDGKQFVGTVHVHPKGSGDAFDAADLTSFLRSDYPGFLDLLIAAESASAIVRTRRFLYISAERVDRDPLLLERTYPGFRSHPTGPAQRTKPLASGPSPSAIDGEGWPKAGVRRREDDPAAAVHSVCHLYEIAFYRGTLNAPLRLQYRPQ